MEMTNVQRRPGALRRALRAGHAVPLTFHDKPLGRVLPEDLIDKLVELAGDKGRQLLDAATPEEAAVA
uniref:hypothetical protein n=1 Tax=Amycolatopsis sp. CA-293810 TaxID=3239926 RepID=UPI003F4971B4